MEKGRYEMNFAGSGGQGVILASVIFAEAAVLNGDNVIQSQAYGPEARGGSSHGETIISKDSIWYSKVTAPNFLLALTQASLDKFISTVAPDAVVIADSGLTVPPHPESVKILQFPILDTAKNEVGKSLTANIVAAGAINSALKLFPDDVMKNAVLLHIPKGTEKLNMLAFEKGKLLAS